MARKNPQQTIYADPRAVAIVGGTSPACNQAIECWARLLREHQPELSREEWMYLCDVLNSTATDASWEAEMLAAEVEDAHRLDGAGLKWLATSRRAADAAVARFIGRVRSWGYADTQHALVAVRFFWAHHNTIDSRRDEWWTVEFRCNHSA